MLRPALHSHASTGPSGLDKSQAGSSGAVADMSLSRTHVLGRAGLLGTELQAWMCPALSFSTDPGALWSSLAPFLPQKVQIYKKIFVLTTDLSPFEAPRFYNLLRKASLTPE